MATEKRTEGHDLISAAYYDKSFRDEPGINLQGNTEGQNRVRENLRNAITQGIESGKITQEDLINFIVGIKINHALMKHYAEGDPGTWD